MKKIPAGANQRGRDRVVRDNLIFKAAARCRFQAASETASLSRPSPATSVRLSTLTVANADHGGDVEAVRDFGGQRGPNNPATGRFVRFSSGFLCSNLALHTSSRFIGDI
jgi:hypothetical protein